MSELSERDHVFTVECKLTQGKVAVIDANDVHLVLGHKWRAIRARDTFYAVAHTRSLDGTRHALYMHRLLLAAAKGLQIDHIDGDGLNNRRSNLRQVTRSQNQHNRKINRNNTTGFKGVSRARRGHFKATISVNGKNRVLGEFHTAEAASEAYQKAAASLRGEFAGTR